MPGATLKITNDFSLYTAPIKQNTTPETIDPPQAIPTHLESSIVVPASGRFTWDVNPSVRPVPAFEADGEQPGPRGLFRESWTITCSAPDGTLLSTSKVVDKGDVANISLCTPRRRRRHRARHALAEHGRAGHVRRLHAGHRQGVRGPDDGERHLDRR
jgi:hypothetical protein